MVPTRKTGSRLARDPRSRSVRKKERASVVSASHPPRRRRSTKKEMSNLDRLPMDPCAVRNVLRDPRARRIRRGARSRTVAIERRLDLADRNAALEINTCVPTFFHALLFSTTFPNAIASPAERTRHGSMARVDGEDPRAEDVTPRISRASKGKRETRPREAREAPRTPFRAPVVLAFSGIQTANDPFVRVLPTSRERGPRREKERRRFRRSDRKGVG